MNLKGLPGPAAEDIYTILVEECGALESMRADFVYHQTREGCHEWRFTGTLGIGGKFWRNGGKWYVNTYPEALMKKVETYIKKANMRLVHLRDKYEGVQ